MSNNKKNHRKALVISTEMGLGHLRAAYPLRDIAENYSIIGIGSKRTCDKKEYKLWKKMLRLYYFCSKAECIPFLGKYIFKLMVVAQRIFPYYPKRDLSRPNWAIKYLTHLILRKNLCGNLIERIKNKKLPVINTYFASAIAIDHSRYNIKNNYCLICDTDINRVWVPLDPGISSIKYFAPCDHAGNRLIEYGVKDTNIHITGFPLPKENIGKEKNMEILRHDLFQRLLRLDPENRFFSVYKEQVLKVLNQTKIPKKRSGTFTVTFAIGGAGAQYDLAKRIMLALKYKIKEGQLNYVLSLGMHKRIYHDFIQFLKNQGLSSYLHNSIRIIYSDHFSEYYNKFNENLRQTDILWTKPSEITFYCALGIPILIAPPIGTHEEYNRKWLINISAGLDPAGRSRYCDEWLFDLRDNGCLARAAWNGFLNAPKTGTYNIEKIVRKII